MKELDATLVNLTPHAMHLVTDSGETWTIPPRPEAEWARVGEKKIPLGWVIDGSLRIRINRKAFDREGATGIPARDGRLFIVSTVVAAAFPERDDFLVPDEIERTDEGLIVGAHALAQMWPASNQVAKEYLERAREAGKAVPPRTASSG